MKLLLSYTCIIFITLFIITGCTSSQQKMENFTDACYDENKSLPMSQIGTLYEGYTRFGDMSAKNTLRENCPKTAKKFFQ